MGINTTKVKHYKTKACKTCLVLDHCTKSKRNGRVIERSEYTEIIEQNKQRTIENRDVYRRRQAIVEHPYGVIKRQWGFYYIMTKKGINRASADVGLIFTAYNLRRIFNLIDSNVLKEFLKKLALSWLMFKSLFKLIFRPFSYKMELYPFSKNQIRMA
jgi:hypothetical protein